MSDTDRTITAYEVQDPTGMPLEPAPLERDWMETADRFPYRCLPLVVANQCGWIVRNPAAFSVRWNGGPRKEDLAIQFDQQAGPRLASQMAAGTVLYAWTGGAHSHAETGGETLLADPRVSSHFGLGVLTFSLPYLFRTPPGVNLWVKGPSNWIKDGAQALEGLVEADWCPATFTMNWKLTRPGRIVRFDFGEPISMLVPFPRGLVEGLAPRQVPLETDPVLSEEFAAWKEGRTEFLDGLHERRHEEVARGWEKDYFKGQTPAGERFAEHQTRLRVRPFTREEDA